MKHASVVWVWCTQRNTTPNTSSRKLKSCYRRRRKLEKRTWDLRDAKMQRQKTGRNWSRNLRDVIMAAASQIKALIPLLFVLGTLAANQNPQKQSFVSVSCWNIKAVISGLPTFSSLLANISSLLLILVETLQLVESAKNAVIFFALASLNLLT